MLSPQRNSTASYYRNARALTAELSRYPIHSNNCSVYAAMSKSLTRSISYCCTKHKKWRSREQVLLVTFEYRCCNCRSKRARRTAKSADCRYRDTPWRTAWRRDCPNQARCLPCVESADSIETLGLNVFASIPHSDEQKRWDDAATTVDEHTKQKRLNFSKKNPRTHG